MDNKFKKNMDEIFDLAPVEVDATFIEPVKVEKPNPDAQKDYEHSRSILYNLIDKGQEAINASLELAQNSDQPRAYEVVALTIKNVAEVAEKLIDLQKKMKDINEQPKSGPTTVNNTMFVGSTADLAKMLKNASKNLDDK